MKISVTIPCFNAAAYIGETIESVLAQTRRADEIIVADDCSTDNSRDVIRQYPQVTLVTQTRNAGCASSRNLAIRASSGDVVAIIDADDLWYPDHLEATVGLLDRYPEAGFAFSGIRRFGLEIDERTTPVAAGVPVDVLGELLAGNILHQPTVVFRRSLYDRCGGFDDTMRYCEDYDLWLRFAAEAPGVYTGRITAGYRIHPGQLNQHHPQMFASTWAGRLKLLQQMKETRPDLADALDQRLGEVWCDGLYTAWAVRSKESLDWMLTLSDQFPGQRAAATAWRRRRRWWPALAMADRLSQLLPAAVRRAIRPPWSGPLGQRPSI